MTDPGEAAGTEVADAEPRSVAPREGPPARVVRFAWTVGVVGMGVAVLLAVLDPRWAAVHVPLGLAVLVSSSAPIQLHLGQGSVHGVTLGESTVVALLIAAPTGVVPVIMAGGLLLSATYRRAEPTKTAYNLGTDALAAACALGTVTLAGGALDGGTLEAIATGILAAIAYQLVQLGLIAELLRRLAGVAPRETVRSSAWTSLVTVAFTTMFGSLLGIAARADAAAAWLGPPMLLALWFSLRDLNEAADATQTSQRLHEVTVDLADVGTDLDSTVRRIADTFDARAVLLRLPYEDDTVEHVHDPGATGVDDLRRAIVEAGGVGPQVVPTARHGQAVVVTVDAPGGRGHLVVAGTTARWSDRQVALLGTLATHLGTILRTLDLLVQVTAESSKLSDIIDAAGDGIALVAVDGTVVTWNPGMQQLTGVGPDATHRPIGEVLVWRAPGGEEVAGALPEALRAALRGEQVDPVDLEVRRGDRWRTARCRFSPVLGPSGVTGVVLVARDRTLESDLVQVKHDFVAIVSHEIRTPLTPLKGMVELLASRGEAITADVREGMVAAMQRQLRRLDALVADLLVVSDLDQGTLRVVPVAVDVAALCRRVVDDEVPDEGRARVRVTVEDGVHALADESVLRRVLASLVSNAVKHGGLPFDVEASVTGEVVRIAVTDHGPGIPAWEQEAVFERFRRIGTNLEWSTQGPGLGLAIASELAEAMGCAIELTSEPGAGATFAIAVPLTSVPADAQHSAAGTPQDRRP